MTIKETLKLIPDTSSVMVGDRVRGFIEEEDFPENPLYDGVIKGIRIDRKEMDILRDNEEGGAGEFGYWRVEFNVEYNCMGADCDDGVLYKIIKEKKINNWKRLIEGIK